MAGSFTATHRSGRIGGSTTSRWSTSRAHPRSLRWPSPAHQRQPRRAAQPNSTLPATFYGFGLSECVPGNCESADGLLRLGNSRIYHDDFIADGFPFLNSKELNRNIFMLPNLTLHGGGCFGDSGGPMTVIEDGQIRVAGVSSFISSETNNFCDGFAIEPGTVFLLHAVVDLVRSDLSSWVTSIKDAGGTCAGLPNVITGSTRATSWWGPPVQM